MDTRIPAVVLGFVLIGVSVATSVAADLPDGRYLYVAEPGVRNYVEYGGHGLLVSTLMTGIGS